MEKKSNVIVTAVVLGLLALVWAVYLLGNPAVSAAGRLLGFVSCGLLGWVLFRFVPTALDTFSAGALDRTAAEKPGRRSSRPERRHPVVQICLAMLAARVVLLLLAYLWSLVIHGYQGGLLDMGSLWYRGDVANYLSIARDGYGLGGDAVHHLAFFPLYPWLVRLLGSSFAGGLILSNLCAVAAGYLLYELTLQDGDRAAAVRAAKFSILFPASFLLGVPLSDGLFLLLSVLCLLLCRKKHWFLGSLVGGLAALTRSFGILLLVPVGWEYALAVCKLHRSQKQTSGRKTARAVLWGVCLLLIPLGLAGYLGLNQVVAGNPFAFLTEQKESWNQTLGLFFHTAGYQLDQLLSCNDAGSALGLWLPNLVALLGGLVLLLVGQKRIRPSYVAYYLVYFVVSMGSGWLLSAPRYLAGLFPVYILLAQVTDKPWRNRLLSAVRLVLLLAYLYCYVKGYPVY